MHTNIQQQWPDLFEGLTPSQVDSVLDAHWRVLRDGFPVKRATLEQIVLLARTNPAQLDALYGPYQPA